MATINEFNGPRAHARQTMWYSLSSLIVAVICHLLQSAAEHRDDPLVLGAAAATVGALLASVVVLWRTVRAFRAQYRVRVLGVHGYAW